MRLTISDEESRTLRRIGDEPFYWIRELAPEVRDWEDQFYDLVDRMKLVWRECRTQRINVCFAVEWKIADNTESSLSILDYAELQRMQNRSNSTLIFVIDVSGKVMGELDMKQEVETTVASAFSRMRQLVIFWLGPELEIFCKGHCWDPRNKQDVLKDIKSKRRDRLLSMENYRAVLDTHYEQLIRDEAGTDYWFPGASNRVLNAFPERIFQKSLWSFLNREVDCIADREPMFKDESRCDIRVFVDNFDLYFIEIKWIGYAAKRRRDTLVITAEDPHEFDISRAIDGAYQTMRYIEKNNAVEFDHRIRLGIYLVYDAYPDPHEPIPYGPEILECPLLDLVEYRLVTLSPSVETKGIAKRKGLV